MKAPDHFDEEMLAPCGINCALCHYHHLEHRKSAPPCPGCRLGSGEKPRHCRRCKIRTCLPGKQVEHCWQCEAFPCVLVWTLERSCRKQYGTSVIENGMAARKLGLQAFLADDLQRWTCLCGGLCLPYTGTCSECGRPLGFR